MTRRDDRALPTEADWAAEILKAAGEFLYLSIERPGQAAHFREMARRLEMIGLRLRRTRASRGQPLPLRIYSAIDGSDTAR
jgi:hypothetical protein